MRFLSRNSRKGAGALTEDLKLENASADHYDECGADGEDHDACFRGLQVQLFGTDKEEGKADQDGGSDAHRSHQREPLAYIRELCKHATFHGSSKDIGQQAVDSDGGEMIMLLALPLMLNLRTLRLSTSTLAPYSGDMSTTFLRYVADRARAARDANVWYPLSLLSTLYVEASAGDYEEENVLNGCAPFLALPSLRKVVIGFLRCANFSWPTELPQSRAQAVFFTEGLVETEAVLGLLRGLEGPCDIFQQEHVYQNAPDSTERPWWHAHKSVTSDAYALEAGRRQAFPGWAIKGLGRGLDWGSAGA